MDALIAGTVEAADLLEHCVEYEDIVDVVEETASYLGVKNGIQIRQTSPTLSRIGH